jgi:serine/threonine protein kinase
MPLTVGQVLNNRYRIVKLLGQGGMGAVYRAWDLNLKGPCALKENFDISPASRAQFEQEAVILFNLHHSNLPRVMDHFVMAGQGQYLVMEYVEGEDLKLKLEKAGGPLPEAQVLPWIAQICDALSYLHAQTPPVIHRDLKPDNIKITPAGLAVLVDFGIAKLFDPKSGTTPGARRGTPGYSPPEQYGHGGKTDARSDVYALGATLYTLLCGQEPPESVQRLANDTLRPPQQVNPRLTPAVGRAILRALEVSQTQRFASVEELRRALPLPMFSSSPAAGASAQQVAGSCPVLTPPQWNLGGVRMSPQPWQQDFELSNTGQLPLTAQLRPPLNLSWLKLLAPMQFQVAPGHHQAFALQVHSVLLPRPGVHTAQVSLQTNGGNLTLPISLTLESGFLLDLANAAGLVANRDDLRAYCDANWRRVARLFETTDRLECALAFLGEANLLQDLADARAVGAPWRNANVGLELFMRKIDPGRLHVQALEEENGDELYAQLTDLRSRLTGKPPTGLMLRLVNCSPRGYLWGEVRPLPDCQWLRIPNPGFGCAAGEATEIKMTVDAATWPRFKIMPTPYTVEVY